MMPNRSQLYFIGKVAAGASKSYGFSDAVFPKDGFAAGMSGINNHPLITFPDNADRLVYFPGVASATYGGGSALVSLFWCSLSIVGDVRWYLAFERDNELGQDIAVDSFAAEGSLLSPAPPVVGQLRKVTFAPNNAAMDGIVAGDPFRFRIRRDGGFFTDNMIGDARLFRVVVEGI